ncbi:hypothetical protein ACQR1I_35840 [Bradyrhizobium sp. HKCCYLS2038]|uniref:hypothetical protein n=1 Tax=Bradyrhizobium sp. HKCCYLS2038 TaxID=3420764 RepID=UPI003EBF7DF5
MTSADTARRFWSAAFYYRRAPDRDRSTAVMVLTDLSTSASGIVQSRAADIMKEIANDADRNTTGPG